MSVQVICALVSLAVVALEAVVISGVVLYFVVDAIRWRRKYGKWLWQD
jgi:hypothetical protein